MRFTKEMVVQIASDMADRDGLSAVSLKRLAEELGLRPPSLYNHIDGLDDLFREIAHRGMRAMNLAMRETAIGKSGDDAIKAVAAAYLRKAIDHPGVYETIQWTFWHGNVETAAIFEEYRELLKKLLLSCSLKTEQLEEMLKLLASFLHGYTTMQLGEAIEHPEKAVAGLLDAIDTVLLGIHQKCQLPSASVDS